MSEIDANEAGDEARPVDVEGADDRFDDWENALIALADESAELDEGDGDAEPAGHRGAAIPVAGGHVSLGQLHPELHRRVAAALADPRLSAVARVSSGVRTYAQQAHLYATMTPGMAANPDYVGADGRKGSKHMVQDATWRYSPGLTIGSYGYAVDIGPWPWAGTIWETLRGVCGEYGLRLTVFSPFEPWHFEIDPAFTGTISTATIPQHNPLVKKGDTGPTVRTLQEFLGERHAITPNIVSDPGPPDGDFGDDTDTAVRSWQEHLGLEADGMWGAGTWKRTERFQRLRNRVLEVGATGQAVKAVQRYLKARRPEAGVKLPVIGKADGDFGPTTESAVKTWQEHLALEADGKWGPATWEASDRYVDRRLGAADDD